MIQFYYKGLAYESHIFKELETDKSHVITVEMKNDKNFNVTLSEPYTEDPDLTITEYTKVLPPNGTGTITMEFAPKGDRDPADCRWGFKHVVVG